MCLAMPVKVLEVGAGETAIIDAGGTRMTISTAMIDPVSVGDYVILHAGFALARLDPDEAARTLALFDEINATPAA